MVLSRRLATRPGGIIDIKDRQRGAGIGMVDIINGK